MSDFGNYSYLLKYEEVKQQIHELLQMSQKVVTLYFKVSLLQCNYTFKYWVMIINYMYLLSVLGKATFKSNALQYCVTP